MIKIRYYLKMSSFEKLSDEKSERKNDKFDKALWSGRTIDLKNKINDIKPKISSSSAEKNIVEKTADAKTASDEQKQFLPPSWEKAPSLSSDRSLFVKGLGIFSGLGKILFWGLIFVFAGVIVVSGFLVYQSRSAKDVSVEIKTISEIQIGVPFEVRVGYRNNSGGLLKNTRLTLELPEGAVLLAGLESQTFIAKEIGEIGPGTASQENYRMVFVRGSNAVKRFNVVLAYQPFSLGSRFETKNFADIAIKEAGVSLDFVLPDKILSGEVFEVKVKYRNISAIDFSGLRLQLDYPVNFEFKKASLNPNSGNNLWVLGDLMSNSEGVLTINGALLGPSDALYNFNGRLSMILVGRNYQVNERTGSVKISPSPLELDITVNGQKELVADPGGKLSYVLSYHNNSNVALVDVIIKARVIGAMFNVKTLPVNLGFNSITNTITWNAATNPELKIIPAGGFGSVGFDINIFEDFPIKRLGDKNFTVKVEGQIESPTVPYNLATQRTIGLARMESKIAGRLLIASKVYFRDAAGGILNQGNFPPKVNQPTQYTVHWQLTNYGTDMKNIEVKANLMPGVVWTEKVKSNIGVLPVYNERTQEIIWAINDLPATKGVISDPAEAIFQISAVPSILHAGKYQPLIGETTMKAFDAFVNAEVRHSALAVGSDLPDDLTIGQQGGLVVE